MSVQTELRVDQIVSIATAKTKLTECLNSFQGRLEVLPEALDRRYLDALVWAMGIYDGRAERHHLHARILLADYAAFQSRVHGDQLGGLAE